MAGQFRHSCGDQSALGQRQSSGVGRRQQHVVTALGVAHDVGTLRAQLAQRGSGRDPDDALEQIGGFGRVGHDCVLVGRSRFASNGERGKFRRAVQ
jgi:hypothetical protein